MAVKFCGKLDTLAEIYDSLTIDLKSYIDNIIESNARGSCLLRLLKVMQKKSSIPTSLCLFLMGKYQLCDKKLDFYAFRLNEHLMNVTLEDVLFLTGLPIDGKPVFSTKLRENDAFTRVFGIEKTTLCISDIKAILGRDGEMELKVKLLLLLVINCMIIPSGDADVLRPAYVQFIDNLEEVNNYAWGAALLSHLYHGMREFVTSKEKKMNSLKKREKKSCVGNAWVVLGFFVYHFRTLREKLCIELPVEQPQVPLFSVAEALQKIGRDRYASYVDDMFPLFDNLQDQDIDWHPYRTEMVPLVLRDQIRFLTRLSPLFCLNFVEHHLPHLLARQFEDLDGVNLDGIGAHLKKIKFKANSGPMGPNLEDHYEKELGLWHQRQLCVVMDASSSRISSSPSTRSRSCSLNNNSNMGGWHDYYQDSEQNSHHAGFGSPPRKKTAQNNRQWKDGRESGNRVQNIELLASRTRRRRDPPITEK